MKTIPLIALSLLMSSAALAAPERARIARQLEGLKADVERNLTYEGPRKRERVRLKVLATLFREAGFKIIEGQTPDVTLGLCGREAVTLKNGDVSLRAYCEMRTNLQFHVKTGITCSAGLMSRPLTRAAFAGLLEDLASTKLLFSAKDDARPETLRIRVYGESEVIYRADGIFREERENLRESELLPRPVKATLGSWEGC